MKRLTLLRHAKAVPSGNAGDHARALSQRGQAQAAQSGTALMQQELPDLALVSDALRTRETFEQLVARFGRQIPHRFTPLLYGAAPTTILELIVATALEVDSLLVVGHNPGLGDLARTLSTTGSRGELEQLAEHFPASAFASIALAGAGWAEAARGGMLERFVTVDC